MGELYKGLESYVFVSYSHNDLVVHDIVNGLIRNKCRVWIDKALNSGDLWSNEIVERITNSKYFLMFISSTYLSSEYCIKELDLAISLNKIIIPFVLDDSSINNPIISNKIGHIQIDLLKDLAIVKQIRNVLNILNMQADDAFERRNSTFFTNSKKKFVLDVYDEAIADRIIKLSSIDLNSGEEISLFDIDTPIGLNPKLTILDVIENKSDNFLEENNSTVIVNFKIDFLPDGQLSEDEISAFISIAIVHPLTDDTKARLLDVKIISPASGKYEINKTIEDLKNETGSFGKEVLDFIEKNVLVKSNDDQGHDCLEREIKSSEIISVKRIFRKNRNGENIFIVPDYQRGYAWSTNKEFYDLWKDILRIHNLNSTQLHYTGLLSLEEIKVGSLKDHEGINQLTSSNAFYVVDGQQRLTSIVIILSSLFDYIELLTGENIAENCLKIDNNKRYRFLYSVDTDDDAREYFISRVYDNSKRYIPKNIYQKNIDEAKTFIDNELYAYSLSEARALLSTILNRIMFNIYFIGDFDVRVTFETMNNRGKQLSNLELLKNRLMYLSTFLNHKFTGNTYYEESVRREINSTWKKIYQNLCFEDYQLDDDEYLFVHWIIYSGLDKTTRDTYIKEILRKKYSVDDGGFRDLLNKGKEINNFDEAYHYLFDYVTSLGNFSHYWRLVNRVNATNAINVTNLEKEWLDKLNRIVDKPFVKATLMEVAQEGRIDVDRKIEFYMRLERALFINKLLGQSDNDYSALTTLARNLFKATTLQEKNAAFDALINKCINDEKNNLTSTDAQIVLAINNLSNKMKITNEDEIGDTDFMYKWNGIKYFLYEYEKSLNLNTDKPVEWDLISKDTIEHIMPQNHQGISYWEIALNGYCEPLITKIKNSFGNMLLLSTSENSKLQNYDFLQKKAINYTYGTNAARQVATDYTYWCPFTIKERELQLYTFMYDRWIHKFGSTMTLNKFITLLKSKHLMLPDSISDLSANTISALCDTNVYGQPVQLPTRIVDQLEIEKDNVASAINKFFRNPRSDRNKSDVRYLKNVFKYTLKHYPRKIVFGIQLEDDTCYRLIYTFENGVNHLKIIYSLPGPNPWITMTNVDVNLLPNEIQYFIETFNRFLKIQWHRDALVLD